MKEPIQERNRLLATTVARVFVNRGISVSTKELIQGRNLLHATSVV